MKADTMRKVAFLLLMVLALATPAFAQSTATIKQNTPFKVAVDHNPFEVDAESDGYKVYVDSVLVRTETVAAVHLNGVATFNFTGLPKGTHIIEIAPYNTAGETKSDPATGTFTPGKPSKPTNIRFIVTVQ